MVKYNDFEMTEDEKQFAETIGKLEYLFEMQQTLMEKYGIEIKDIDTKEGQQQLRDCGMWLFEEIGEIFHCLKNKAWTQQDHEVDKNAMYDEVADAWHFFIELNILLGMTPASVVELYTRKHKANLKRIETRY